MWQHLSTVLSRFAPIFVAYDARGHTNAETKMAEWGLDRGVTSPVFEARQRQQAGGNGRTAGITGTELAEATAQGAATSEDVHEAVAEKRASQ